MPKLNITYIDSGKIDLEEAIINIYCYIGQKVLIENNITGYRIVRPDKKGDKSHVYDSTRNK